MPLGINPPLYLRVQRLQVVAGSICTVFIERKVPSEEICAQGTKEGARPIIDYTGRLRPNRALFSGLSYIFQKGSFREVCLFGLLNELIGLTVAFYAYEKRP